MVDAFVQNCVTEPSNVFNRKRINKQNIYFTLCTFRNTPNPFHIIFKSIWKNVVKILRHFSEYRFQLPVDLHGPDFSRDGNHEHFHGSVRPLSICSVLSARAGKSVPGNITRRTGRETAQVFGSTKVHTQRKICDIHFAQPQIVTVLCILR